MEKKSNNGIKFKVIIALLLILVLTTTLIIIFMPKRVCHTEEHTEKIVIGGIENKNICYPLNTEIICEEGLIITSYSGFKEKCIWNKTYNFGKICLITTKQKVCEIR